MEKLTETQNLTHSALLSGMDRKTARRYRDAGALPSESAKPHSWRTRPNPFQEVWAEIEAPAMETVVPATPTGPLTSRRIRYAIGRGLQRVTRETTCNRLSMELGAFLAQPDTILLGIDGINGFTCGPTQEELRMLAVPLGAIARKQGVSSPDRG